jgi:hypothetical protein
VTVRRAVFDPRKRHRFFSEIRLSWDSRSHEISSGSVKDSKRKLSATLQLNRFSPGRWKAQSPGAGSFQSCNSIFLLRADLVLGGGLANPNSEPKRNNPNSNANLKPTKAFSAVELQAG